MRALRSALALHILLVIPAIASAEPDPWSGADRKPGRIAQIARTLGEEAWFVPGGPAADGNRRY